MGLEPLTNSPCIFKGKILPDSPELFLGLYVDDFVYFSTCPKVEEEFARRLKQLNEVDFMGKVSHFLGLKFQWTEYNDDNGQQQLKVHLSQKAFAENLVQLADLTTATSHPTTPYRSGFPVDAVPETTNTADKVQLQNRLRQLVGSMLWLSQGSRPDISTITSMIAQYQNRPSKGHIDAARYAIRYIKQTSDLGIVFDSINAPVIMSHTHFPKNPLHAITDSNWGAQDLSRTPDNTQLPLFKSLSVNGHIINLYGPIQWQSKRQTITARSSAEAEIYATDECVRELIYIRKLIRDLGFENTFLSNPITIHNDNSACVQWYKNRITRSIPHIQLRDNAVREEVQKKKVRIKHIPGSDNIADIFTKEDRDKQHFTTLRNMILFSPFKCNNTIFLGSKLFFDTHVENRLVLVHTTGGVRTLRSIRYIRDTHST